MSPVFHGSSDAGQFLSAAENVGTKRSHEGAPRDHSPSADSSASPSSPVSKRFQVPRACERCKRLRRGCSEYRPCLRCINAGVQDQCQARATPLPPISPMHDAHSDHQRLVELLPGHLLDYCIERFFETLHPTIPILTVSYIARLRSTSMAAETGLESQCVLVAMCAQVLLQVDGPPDHFATGEMKGNPDYGRHLLETAISIYETTTRRIPPTIEMCLFTFFLYACAARLFHHSQAFRFLRESTTMLELFRPPEADEVIHVVYNRLFWVLLVSERSHAIRYRRQLTIALTDASPTLDCNDRALTGFWSLAALFRPLDTVFVGLHNREITAMAPSREHLTAVETAVNSALKPGLELHATQKANLRVTQLWLRVIIWQLRLRLGHLVESHQHSSLTYRYPIEIAKDLVLSTCDLPPDSFRVHGVGLTEKLFDIASALVDVLARVPLTLTTSAAMPMGNSPSDDLSYVQALIRKLPGNSIYEDLLEKHIEQAVRSSVDS